MLLGVMCLPYGISTYTMSQVLRVGDVSPNDLQCLEAVLGAWRKESGKG